MRISTTSIWTASGCPTFCLPSSRGVLNRNEWASRLSWRSILISSRPHWGVVLVDSRQRSTSTSNATWMRPSGKRSSVGRRWWNCESARPNWESSGSTTSWRRFGLAMINTYVHWNELPISVWTPSSRWSCRKTTFLLDGGWLCISEIV
jgi:hypothetical protein